MEIQEIIEASPVACFIFAVTIASSLIAFRDQQFLRKWMLNPYQLVHQKKYWQVFTSGLIHADLMHLAFNMLSFYFFAISTDGIVPLEEMMTGKVGPVGHLYFGIIYIGAMVLGDLTTIYKQKDNPSYYSLGASGAISGIIFSYILFSPTSRLGVMFLPNMPAPLFALLFVVFSIFAAKSRNTNINHDAHIWGGLFGFALTIPLFPGILPSFWLAVQHMLHLI